MFEKDFNNIHRNISNCLFSMKESMILGDFEDFDNQHKNFDICVNDLKNLIIKIQDYNNRVKLASYDR